jgi:hypothetical protein
MPIHLHFHPILTNAPLVPIDYRELKKHSLGSQNSLIQRNTPGPYRQVVGTLTIGINEIKF